MPISLQDKVEEIFKEKIMNVQLIEPKGNKHIKQPYSLTTLDP